MCASQIFYPAFVHGEDSVVEEASTFKVSLLELIDRDGSFDCQHVDIGRRADLRMVEELRVIQLVEVVAFVKFADNFVQQLLEYNNVLVFGWISDKNSQLQVMQFFADKASLEIERLKRRILIFFHRIKAEVEVDPLKGIM